jgi:lipopolysaccharide export system protein LptA
MSRLLLFISLFFVSLPMFSQELRPDTVPSRPVKKSYVHLLHTDITRFDEAIDPEAWILVGNVNFRRDSMYMFCDSAHYYQKRNSFLAFGNVRMEQGDTLFLYGDYLDFDGVTNVARVRNNVRLIDKDIVLETDSLDYDRNRNLGYFFEYGVLYDSTGVLRSYYGDYNVDTRTAVFLDDVTLENSKFLLLSDTLYYNTDSKVATIVGPTNMYTGGTEVYSDHGTFNTATRHATLVERPVLYNDNRNVTADSIFYDTAKGYSEVFGDIVYTDTINRNMLTGEYAFLDEVRDSVYVTGRAMAVDFSQRDSLFVHSDTIWAVTYNLDTDSLYRKVKAYNKVRAWGRNMQAVCDSLVFDSRDTCMTMYKDPIMWNGDLQLLGEEVKVYMNDSTINWVNIINQALYVEELDSSIYNQIKGKEMEFYFTDGELREMHVIGSVEVVFYPLDSDSTYIGMNTTTSGRIIAYMKDRKVERVVVPKDSKGVFYPMSQRPEEKRFLDSFAWFDYVRPLSKWDIFNWRGKGGDKELKVIKKEKIPLPTLDRFKK